MRTWSFGAIREFLLHNETKVPYMCPSCAEYRHLYFKPFLTMYPQYNDATREDDIRVTAGAVYDHKECSCTLTNYDYSCGLALATAKVREHLAEFLDGSAEPVEAAATAGA